MVIKFISLLLILGSLGVYQTIAAARAEQRAATAAQIKVTENRPEKPADAKYLDGVYEGEGFGFGGDIRVNVTIKDGNIHAIDVLEHSGEDDEYFRLAVGMIDKIIESNHPDVDTVTGSTFSSQGLLEAIRSALEKAVKS